MDEHDVIPGANHWRDPDLVAALEALIDHDDVAFADVALREELFS